MSVRQHRAAAFAASVADGNVCVCVYVAERAECNCGQVRVWTHKMMCDYSPGPAAEVAEVEGVAAEVAGGAAGGGMVGRGVIYAMAFCNSSWISARTASASMGFGETSVLLPGLSGCLSAALMIKYGQVGMRLQIPESKQLGRTRSMWLRNGVEACMCSFQCTVMRRARRLSLTMLLFSGIDVARAIPCGQ